MDKNTFFRIFPIKTFFLKQEITFFDPLLFSKSIDLRYMLLCTVSGKG